MSITKRSFLGFLAALPVVAKLGPAKAAVPASPIVDLTPMLAPEPAPLFGEWRAFFGPIVETPNREAVMSMTYKIFDGRGWHLIDSEEGQAVMRALTAQWVPVEAEHADLDRLAAPTLYEYGADAR